MSQLPIKSSLKLVPSEKVDRLKSVTVSECYYNVGGVEETGSTKGRSHSGHQTQKKNDNDGKSFVKKRQTFNSVILKRRLAAISDFGGPEVTVRKRWKLAGILILLLVGIGVLVGITIAFIPKSSKTSEHDIAINDGSGNLIFYSLYITKLKQRATRKNVPLF